MKIYYNCEHCGQVIDMIEVDQVDEVKFGFDCLTAEERQDIIKIDSVANVMYVHSLCDECIESLGLVNVDEKEPETKLLH
ncbi:anti-sigma-F factor Fin [Pelosinus sp. sgz500959]|uniref:anti-sigma-F factor Fin n=1 Tax=Pelosinus sp. sgz500959 TaxID=3242472 RepID=UPI0036721098